MQTSGKYQDFFLKKLSPKDKQYIMDKDEDEARKIHLKQYGNKESISQLKGNIVTNVTHQKVKNILNNATSSYVEIRLDDYLNKIIGFFEEIYTQELYELIHKIIETNNVNEVDGEGNTLLMYVAKHGRYEIVEPIIQSGIDIEKRNHVGKKLLR